MNRDEIWQVIGEQREAVADLLAGLDEAQWREQSLCTGWTVRDVAAHLTLQQLRLRDVPMMLTQMRGSIDKTIAHMARKRAAALSTDRIVAEIRATVGSRRHQLGVTYLENLADILVHGQDIAIPLGIRHDIPPRAAAVAADRLLSSHWPPPLPGVRAVAGFRLTATDIDWSAAPGPARGTGGDGATEGEVRGPMAALLLVCAGRAAALPQLSGPGAPALTARFGATAPA